MARGGWCVQDIRGKEKHLNFGVSEGLSVPFKGYWERRGSIICFCTSTIHKDLDQIKVWWWVIDEVSHLKKKGGMRDRQSKLIVQVYARDSKVIEFSFPVKFHFSTWKMYTFGAEG